MVYAIYSLVLYGFYLAVFFVVLRRYAKQNPSRIPFVAFALLAFPYTCDYAVQGGVIVTNRDMCPDKNGALSRPPERGGIFIAETSVPRKLIEKHELRILTLSSIARTEVEKRHDAVVPLFRFFRKGNGIPVFTEAQPDQPLSHCADEEVLSACLQRLFPSVSRIHGVAFSYGRKPGVHSWHRLSYVFWKGDKHDAELVAMWESLSFSKGVFWKILAPWGDGPFYSCSTKSETFDDWYMEGITQ